VDGFSFCLAGRFFALWGFFFFGACVIVCRFCFRSLWGVFGGSLMVFSFSVCVLSIAFCFGMLCNGSNFACNGFLRYW
jgi:hypothetical protein